ncbi:MAG: hypothetical protein NT163_09645 [Chlorobiales bacterium]|nr:hypothetical protein [Chlorobiales bacterium]
MQATRKSFIRTVTRFYEGSHQLDILDFRAFLNLAMLITESERKSKGAKRHV